MVGRIVILSGPPGGGKSTLARRLAAASPRSVCLPLDQVREWVVSGIAHPVPEWSDETARQFELAEDSAADVAVRYVGAGFDVFLDHCRLPENIEAWVSRSFAGHKVEKVAVLPSLSTVLSRNRVRDNKDFDPVVLEPVIHGVHAAFACATLDGWVVVENEGSVDETAAAAASALGL